LASSTSGSASSKKMEESYENGENSSLDIKPKKKLPDDVNKWPLEIHNAILAGLLRYKPVGINASFAMMALMDHLHSATPSTNSEFSVSFQSPKHHLTIFDYDITPDDIWKYLRTFYDLTALEQTEPVHPLLNFGGDSGGPQFNEFTLPEAEFGILMQVKMEKSKGATNTNPIPIPAPDSPPPAKQRKTKGKGPPSRQVTVGEDTESVSSSRSSTPASGGNTAAALTVSAPTTRRSRQRKD